MGTMSPQGALKGGGERIGAQSQREREREMETF